LEIDLNSFEKFRNNCIKLVDFKDRPLNTFMNEVQGLNLIRKAFKRYSIELDVKLGAEYIAKNIITNILQNRKETKSQVENMFELLDEMISNGYGLIDGLRVDKDNECVYLYIPIIYPAVKKYIRDFNLEAGVLSKNDFIKQLKGSKYLVDKSVMNIRINNKVKKSYKLDLNLLDDLGLDNICMFEPVSNENGEQIPF